jgi:hypothetical protein
MDHDKQGCQPPSSIKVERKIVEKNRRNQMKILFSKLNSHLPRCNPKVICYINFHIYIERESFFLIVIIMEIKKN